VRLPQGQLCVDLRDTGVGRPLFCTRRYETQEMQWLCRLLQRGQTFVDVGAHVGYFTTLAARRVGPAGRVVAVEPDPYNFLLLRRNVRRNRLSNVVIAHCALGAKAGNALLYEAQENLGDHRLHVNAAAAAQRHCVDIALETLDALLEHNRIGPPDVIKIDVQGSEAGVIAGMGRLLSGDRPLTLLLEFWPYGLAQAGASPQTLFDTLAQAGFTARALGDEQDLSFEQVLARIGPINTRCPDHSFVNLVFRRSARQRALAA
jgi:FkbM family methyltransferase